MLHLRAAASARMPHAKKNESLGNCIDASWKRSHVALSTMDLNNDICPACLRSEPERLSLRVRRTKVAEIISLTGYPAAGKSTVAKHLQDRHGAHWVRTRDIVQLLGGSGTLQDLQNKGLTLSSEKGAELFFVELQKLIHPTRTTVIDAIRPFSHWTRIKAAFGPRAHLVGVKAPSDTRRARFEEREPGSCLRERDEHEVEREIPGLLEVADYVLVNTSSLTIATDLLMAFAHRESLPSYSSLLSLAVSGGAWPVPEAEAGAVRDLWQRAAARDF
jgi:dephospho-CoA kinase